VNLNERETTGEEEKVNVFTEEIKTSRTSGTGARPACEKPLAS